MNERILTLAASCFPRDGDGNINATPEIIAEFAKLVVQECLSVGEDVANSDGSGSWFEGYTLGVEEVNRRIKQHFGVE